MNRYAKGFVAAAALIGAMFAGCGRSSDIEQVEVRRPPVAPPIVVPATPGERIVVPATPATPLTPVAPGTPPVVVPATQAGPAVAVAPQQWAGWKFDFNQDLSPTPAGFLGVRGTDVYRDTGAPLDFGWDAPVGEFARTGPSDLLLDGHFNKDPHTFRMDVPAAGDYRVKVSIGDELVEHDHMRVSAEGKTMADEITTAIGQFVERTFTVTVLDGTLDVEFRDVGPGNQDWVVNAMEVYPPSTASVILTAPTATAAADGTTIDRLAGSGVSPGSLVTVVVEGGRLVSADASAEFAGVQVLADAYGKFEVALQRPATAGPVRLTTSEVAGTQFGESTIVYGPPAVVAERVVPVTP